MYRYAANNPVVYVDPDGEALIAIAAVGFAIGAITSFVSSFIENDCSFSNMDWKETAKNMVIDGCVGGASALLSVTGAGLLVQTVGNAAFSSIGELAKQLTDNDVGIDGWSILSNSISGAIAGFVGGPGNKNIGSQLKRMERRVLTALKHNDFKEIGKAIAYFGKNTETLSKHFRKEMIKDAIKDFIPNEIRDDVIDKIIEGFQSCMED